MKMCAEMRTIMSIELKEFKDKMGKSLDSLASEYTTIRAGRANPHRRSRKLPNFWIKTRK